MSVSPWRRTIGNVEAVSDQAPRAKGGVMFRTSQDEQISSNKKSSFGLRVTVTLAAALILAPIAASAARSDVRVLPPQTSPHGATYGEWGATWWQWALGVPMAANPVADATGENCGVGQAGQVWFLAGTFGGSASRSCAVPAGRALFFPVVNSAFIATDEGETEALAHTASAARIDGVDTTSLTAEIDGVSVDGLDQYRAHSPTFYVAPPEGNLFGLPAGTYGPAAADGYWLMLPPLAPGSHTLHFGGAFASGTTVSVTYQLLVG
jgi:hypothetical protein